jgi:hypothetical protein
MMRRAQRISDEVSPGLDRVADATCLLVHHQLTKEGPLLRTSALTAVPSELRDVMTHRLDRITSRFADAITDGVIDGSVLPCDASIAAQMITATINSTEELPRWIRGVTAETAIELYARPGLLGLFS